MFPNITSRAFLLAPAEQESSSPQWQPAIITPYTEATRTAFRTATLTPRAATHHEKTNHLRILGAGKTFRHELLVFSKCHLQL